MTLRNFLDASYALLCQDFMRVNPLLDADTVLEKVRQRFNMNAQPQPAPAAVVPAGVTLPPSQNDASMKMLMGQLSQIKGAPKMPRRTK